MMEVIPLAVLVLVWVFMDPPQRYDSPYTRGADGKEIDYYTEKLIALSPKIELSRTLIERMGNRTPYRSVAPEVGHIMLIRLGDDIIRWCVAELGYAPTIAHNHRSENFILFKNDDDAMHFFMRWL